MSSHSTISQTGMPQLYSVKKRSKWKGKMLQRCHYKAQKYRIYNSRNKQEWTKTSSCWAMYLRIQSACSACVSTSSTCLNFAGTQLSNRIASGSSSSETFSTGFQSARAAVINCAEPPTKSRQTTHQKATSIFRSAVQTLRKHLEVIELTTNFSRSNLCNIHTLHHSLLLLTNIRSRVADYIIFLTTLYDIIFQWWSYTRNSDQTVFVEHEVVKKQLKLPPQIVMS